MLSELIRVLLDFVDSCDCLISERLDEVDFFLEIIDLIIELWGQVHILSDLLIDFIYAFIEIFDIVRDFELIPDINILDSDVFDLSIEVLCCTYTDLVEWLKPALNLICNLTEAVFIVDIARDLDRIDRGYLYARDIEREKIKKMESLSIRQLCYALTSFILWDKWEIFEDTQHLRHKLEDIEYISESCKCKEIWDLWWWWELWHDDTWECLKVWKVWKLWRSRDDLRDGWQSKGK